MNVTKKKEFYEGHNNTRLPHKHLTCQCQIIQIQLLRPKYIGAENISYLENWVT